ncbi:MAG: purine-nucleoside phosphorylase [Candidatus Nanopelagicales bacterium]
MPGVRAAEAAADIADRSGSARHDIALVLGSGWAAAADELGSPSFEAPLDTVPYFTAPVVTGHSGRLRSLEIHGRRVLIFLGRTHLYEGLGTDAVSHSVRTAAACGVESVILTNAAGSLVTQWAPGTAVLISDHLNLTGDSPLVGAQFISMTDAYSPRLRHIARDLFPSMPEGVYAQLRGPMYETPAEIRMLRTLGADLVGMSTALETIAARAAGLEVLGLSLVTNLAAGMTGEALDHGEVLATGQESAGRLGRMLAEIIRAI